MTVPRLARLALALPLLVALPLAAQAPTPPDTAKMKAEIAKLSWMIGTWEGDAWIQHGQEKLEMRQKETVALRLDGLSLLIDGEGRAKSDPSKVQYRALGVLYWDPYSNGAKLASWTGEGHAAFSSVTIGKESVIWELATPQSKIRYTAKKVGAAWNEIGEWSADGKTWTKFMEMNLKKSG
jgi:hypothetical protein